MPHLKVELGVIIFTANSKRPPNSKILCETVPHTHNKSLSSCSVRVVSFS